MDELPYCLKIGTLYFYVSNKTKEGLFLKSFELQPTVENLYKTLQADVIGRNSDLYYFVKLLNGLDDNTSISLDGQWGSGKTFFVKQAKLIFDSFNSFLTTPFDDDMKEKIEYTWKKINNENYPDDKIDIEPQVAVYYDAWENDNLDDPIISIIYSITKQINCLEGVISSKGIKDAFLSIANAILNRDIKQIVDDVREANVLSDVIIKKELKEQISEFLDNIPQERGNRVIVFIDELDRCNPNFAVKLLERIKHYFTNERFTFVFSTNIYELEHTIKTHYGNEFDAGRYLDRFFNIRLSLGPIPLENYISNVFYSKKDALFDMCTEVCKKYGFQMREMCKYFLLVQTAVHNYVESRKSGKITTYNGYDLLAYCFVPIIIGLKMANTQKYISFVSGNDSSPLFDFINCFNDYFKEELLKRDETFGEDGDDKKSVKIEDKLEQIYSKIFKDNHVGTFNFGGCRFNHNTKESVLRMCGLLSSYSNYDFDDGE